MKFFAVFAAVLALAAGSYSPVQSWTLSEIEAALQDPNTDPAKIPYLIDGLNALVASLFSGAPHDTIILSIPVEETVTLEQLTSAIHDPSTDPAVLPYLENAFQDLMVAMNNGQEQDTITLTIPAMNVNMWTLNQLSDALENPETDPELVIYLEHALNQYMEALVSGNQISSIAVITPPGVIATAPEAQVVAPVPVVIPETPVVPPTPIVVSPEAEPVAPTPVIVAPEAEPVAPVSPGPVVAPEAVPVPSPVSSAPLVQLIVNVNTKQQEAVAPDPSPAVVEAVEDKPVIAVNPAGWNPAPVEDKPVIAVNPAGWNPAPVEDKPVIAVNPADWHPAPIEEQPAIAVGPWA